MKKKLLAILSLLALAGAGCIKTNQIIKPTVKNQDFDPHYKIVPTIVVPSTSTFEDATSTKNNLLKLKAFSATSSKVFNEPNADFTFEYPSSFSYTENLRPRQEDPNSRTWDFTYKNQISDYDGAMGVFAPPYEPAFDSCLFVLDKKSVAYSETGVPSFTKFNVYPTNDPKTTVLVQTCGFATYITFENGYHPQTIEEQLKNTNTHKIDIKKYHILGLYAPNTPNTSKPPQQFLDWVERIGKSIKIK